MTIAALVVVCLCVVVLVVRERDHQELLLRVADAERAERAELLTRIQHPERPVLSAPAEFVLPELEPDEIDLVGTIAEPI